MKLFPQIKNLTDFDITDSEAIERKKAEWEELAKKVKELRKEDNKN